MSAITKTQKKSLMKDIKEGRTLKKVLEDGEKACLFHYNHCLKSIIIHYNLTAPNYWKNDRSKMRTRQYNSTADQISNLLNQRNIVLGRKEEKKKRVSSFTYDADPSYLIRRMETREKWNNRIAEMARYEAMGALWCGTNLCEDVIGEIMSYL